MKVNLADDCTNSMTSIGLPQALEIVGDANYYQWRTFLIMCLILSIASFHVTGQAYIFVQPPLLCDGKPCVEDYCSQNFTITVDIDNFKYDNVVTNYQLWCNRKNLGTIAQSMYFLGSILGGGIMSYFGVFYLKIYFEDKYGRSKTYIASWIIFTLGAMGMFACQSIYFYMLTNAIMGFGGITIYILNYVILNETSGKRFRQTASIGILAAWSLAEMVASLVYYNIHDWKIVFGFAILLPAVVGVFLTLLIQETPQYYQTKKLNEQLISTLDKIAVINKRQTFSSLMPSIYDKLDPTLKHDDSFIPKPVENARTYNILDLFKYKSLRNASIGFTFISFTLHLIFYGGEYSISDISQGKSLYILGAVMGLVELISYIMIYFVIQILPRRRTILISYILSLICCGCFIFFGWSSDATKVDCNFCSKQILVIALACFIRIFNCLGFSIQGLYANEVYPTCVRSLGTGFLFSMGIFGSFLSPYVIALGDTLQINPYILIGAISFTGPVATLLIRETLNQKLPDQIQEDNKMSDLDSSASYGF